jgi:hypothetical protein
VLQFKEGVRVKGLQPQMLLALQVVEEEFAKMGLDTVVTSANDSEHKDGSKHYEGAAFDFRTKHSGGMGKGLASSIRLRLAHIGFDVLFEYPGGEAEHIHVEWDPKY